MSEIIEPKVVNPKNSVIRNEAISSHPSNLNFFQDEVFQLFSYLNGLNGSKSTKMKLRASVERVQKLVKKT